MHKRSLHPKSTHMLGDAKSTSDIAWDYCRGIGSNGELKQPVLAQGHPSEAGLKTGTEMDLSGKKPLDENALLQPCNGAICK